MQFLPKAISSALMLSAALVLSACGGHSPSSTQTNNAGGGGSGGGNVSGTALPLPPDDAEKLTIVVAVVDSLMPEDISNGMTNVQALMANGTSYTESRSVFSAETIPNHVAMMTGVYPDRNGIPTNNFWDKEAAPNAPDDEDLDNPNEIEAKTLFTWIDEKCRRGADAINADITTAATMSKKYLHQIFLGDANDPQENDAGISNVEPDLHWDPTTSPGYIDQGSEHTVDNFTGPQAATDLMAADFIFINLGDVDRSSHAGGGTARNVTRVTADEQIGSLVTQLQDAGRWENTVFILTSDHGMDFSDPTSNAPEGEAVFTDPMNVVGAGNALLNSLSTQPLLDSLASPVCGYEPILAVQNGGTNSLVVSSPNPTAAERQDTLLAARACLMNFNGDNSASGAPPSCASVVGDVCKATLVAPVNLEQIAFAWYANPELYNGAALTGSLSADTGGIMPATIKSRHENLGDLVLVISAGFKFSESGPDGNPIPGNHGHMPTIHNTMIVSGGADFLNRNVIINDGSTDHFARTATQSENTDIAATVAWLLGLNIQDSDFPDAGQSFPDYGDGVTRAGFDGRVLSEAFTISNPPSNCGLLFD